jgi:GNAT superfamily N-acetyltransferase
MRFFGRARDNGEVKDLPGVAVIYCGLDYAAFNAAVMSSPVSREGAELEERIASPGRHFHDRGLRWSYWFSDDYVRRPFLRRARALLEREGMSQLTDAPGMLADSLAPPSRRLPNLVVKPVCDDATRNAFAHITSISFDVPWTVCREIYIPERAWRGSFRGFLGYVNGTAVTSTAFVFAAGAVGVYSVGTLPGHRSRGYAEALMRNVLDKARAETGCQRTSLQSTRSGYQLYLRMGYRPVTNYTVYMTD